ncbi:MAG: Rid family detoxifying hydrolase [Elusimicrobia bacterium]|nr:Rid family detoxifying hydrolase [Elusimicrobiota bacterium]MDE2314122.1 Rid family detoxifying hydrolase [Elusimicrobiota bacterium]
MKKAVLSRKAPKPIGPYSQGVDCGKMVFVSGQIPADAAGNLTGPAVSEQTERCLDNLEAVLKAAGLGLKDVVKTTVFMTDLVCFSEMNEAYAKRFKPPYPARAAVQVSALPKGAAVEIEAVAARS